MYRTNLKFIAVFLLAGTFAMNACNKAADQSTSVVENIQLPPVLQDKQATFYVLIKGQQLAKFNLQNLTTPESVVTLDGMESAENIVSIDFRPATGQLYGIGNTSRLYVINPMTGKVRPVGTTPFSPALVGTMNGFDFNPTVDRIRVVTSNGQNLRLNPETGTVAATDGPISIAGAAITGAAYTNNTAGATTTILYDIDVTSKKLYKQDPPNNGTLVEVGSLGEDIRGEGGFDIAPDGSIALAAYGDKLYYINLETGKATNIGNLGTFTDVTGLAIQTNPVAYAVDETNNLLIFNPMKPEPVMKPITGLPSGENIKGIDFRPFNGQLYALSSASKIYTVNTSNGAVTMVGAAPFSTPLEGTSFGFDFNPTVDRIRIVSNTGQNLRVHPETGAIAAIDMNINPAGSSITQVAYTNNFSGATSTVLYDIDATSDKLFRQDPPNNGTLVEVGPLGFNATAMGGFDIGGTSGIAYALLHVDGGSASNIYTISLTDGKVTVVAGFPKSVTGFAVGLGF